MQPDEQIGNRRIVIRSLSEYRAHKLLHIADSKSTFKVGSSRRASETSQASDSLNANGDGCNVTEKQVVAAGKTELGDVTRDRNDHTIKAEHSITIPLESPLSLCDPSTTPSHSCNFPLTCLHFSTTPTSLHSNQASGHEFGMVPCDLSLLSLRTALGLEDTDDVLSPAIPAHDESTRLELPIGTEYSVLGNGDCGLATKETVEEDHSVAESKTVSDFGREGFTSLSSREYARLNKHCLLLLAAQGSHVYISRLEIVQRVHLEMYGKNQNFHRSFKHQLYDRILSNIAERSPRDALFPQKPRDLKFRLNTNRGYEEMRKLRREEIDQWPHFTSRKELLSALNTHKLATGSKGSSMLVVTSSGSTNGSFRSRSADETASSRHAQTTSPQRHTELTPVQRHLNRLPVSNINNPTRKNAITKKTANKRLGPSRRPQSAKGTLRHFGICHTNDLIRLGSVKPNRWTVANEHFRSQSKPILNCNSKTNVFTEKQSASCQDGIIETRQQCTLLTTVAKQPPLSESTPAMSEVSCQYFHDRKRKHKSDTYLFKDPKISNSACEIDATNQKRKHGEMNAKTYSSSIQQSQLADNRLSEQSKQNVLFESNSATSNECSNAQISACVRHGRIRSKDSQNGNSASSKETNSKVHVLRSPDKSSVMCDVVPAGNLDKINSHLSSDKKGRERSAISVAVTADKTRRVSRVKTLKRPFLVDPQNRQCVNNASNYLHGSTKMETTSTCASVRPTVIGKSRRNARDQTGLGQPLAISTVSTHSPDSPVSTHTACEDIRAKGTGCDAAVVAGSKAVPPIMCSPCDLAAANVSSAAHSPAPFCIDSIFPQQPVLSPTFRIPKKRHVPPTSMHDDHQPTIRQMENSSSDERMPASVFCRGVRQICASPPGHERSRLSDCASKCKCQAVDFSQFPTTFSELGYSRKRQIPCNKPVHSEAKGETKATQHLPVANGVSKGVDSLECSHGMAAGGSPSAISNCSSSFADLPNAFQDLYDEYSRLCDFVTTVSKEFGKLADEPHDPQCCCKRRRSLEHFIQARFRTFTDEHECLTKHKRYHDLYHTLKPFDRTTKVESTPLTQVKSSGFGSYERRDKE